MPERYTEFDELRPEQALDIMAQAVEPVYLDLLRRVRFAIDKDSDSVSLFAPQNYRRGEKQIGVQFQQLLQARYEAVAGGRTPRIGVQLPERTLSLPEDAALLLYLTNNKDQWSKELAVVSTEHLLVGLAQPETAELTEQLRIHATHTRINKSVAPDKIYTIYHVADDQSRGSTFSGLIAADMFIGWHMLKAVAHEDYRLFLPPEFWPKPEALAAFCRLLQNAPQLFSPHPPRSDHRLLAALVQQPENDEVMLVFLRNLFFTDQLEIGLAVAAYTRFTICSLADSPQKIKQLHNEIQSLESRVGYRLELRATQFRQEVEIERERLMREWHELNYQMELLNAYNLCRPTLLRFTSAQLVALGEYLSRLPGKTVRDGRLLYGFQATDHDPEGLHFLYVDPTLVKEPDLDPLIRWSRLDEGRPMRFWPDPFWAQHYSDKNRSKLFVPEFSTLFPTIHDWNVETREMDGYLQKTVRHWLRERLGTDPFTNKPFPRTPIYVFDGPCDPWADIEIYILDLATFRPLQTYLGWLNDNLAVRTALEVEPIITQVAADEIWTSVAQQVSQRKAKVEQDFTDTSSQLAQQIAERTAVLMRTLTDKLEQLQAAADQQRQEIGELQARLDQLVALCRRVVSTAQLALQSERRIRDNMSDFQQTEKILTDEVEEFHQRAETLIEKTSSEIDGLIAQLRHAYQREEEKLRTLGQAHGRR